jgi:DNA-binding transcriptional LysR family regulator
VAFETQDIGFTCALVNAGAGVAIVPELMIGAHAVRRVPLGTFRNVHVVHRASAAALPSVRAVIEALFDAVDADTAQHRWSPALASA